MLGIFLLGFCGSLYVALTPANSMMHWYDIDDSFYYYKVAQNVLAGYGFSFDQINPTNGFHPLWMVICLGVFWLSRFNLLLPLRVLILVSGILNGLTGVFLFRLLKKSLHPYAAFAGALVWILLPSIYNTTTVHGMEAAISSFFLVFYLSQCVTYIQHEYSAKEKAGRLLILGLLGSLTILSRLDNLFVVLVVGIFTILKVHRINRLLIFDLVAILIGSILSWVVRFGTSPVTLNSFSIYPLLLAGLIIKPVVLFFADFYSSTIKDRLPKYFLNLGISSIVILALEYVGLSLLRLLGFRLLLSRSVIVIDLLISITLITLIRLIGIPRFSFPHSHHSTWQVFTNWMKKHVGQILANGLLYAVPMVLLIGSYMVINKVFFGTFSPVSGQIKTWWGTLSNTIYASQSNLIELLGLSPNSSKGPWSLLTSLIAKASESLQHLINPVTDAFPTRLFLGMAFIAFILLVFLLSRKNGYLARKSFSLLIPALIIGGFFQITFYTARGYAHTRFWYWIAECLVLVLLGAVFSSRLFEKLYEWTKSEIPGFVLLIMGTLTLLFMHSRFLFTLSPHQVTPENSANYLASTRELEKYTDEGTLIGMTGGGTTAYFIQNRTIVNLDGLINSAEYFQSMKTGTAGQFLDKLPLDYIYGKPYTLLESDPYNAIFRGRLKEIGVIHGDEGFTLYRYLSLR